MKIVFMGTPDFSVPVLEALVKAGHQVEAVVTQPDKPKGRGKAVLMTPVKEKAMELGIPVYQPVKVREPEFIEVLKELKPDVMVLLPLDRFFQRQSWIFRLTAVSMFMHPCFRSTAVRLRSSGW